MHTHTHACSFTGMSLNAHASTQRYFHTKILLRRDFLARRCFHTRKRFYTHILLHRDDYGRHQFCAKEFSKQVQNQNFTAALDLGAFCAKGFCERKQHVNFTGFFFQRSNRIYCKRIYRQNHPNAEERNFTAILTCFDDRNTEGLRKITFSAVFEDRDAFRGKGLRLKPTLQLHLSF